MIFTLIKGEINITNENRLYQKYDVNIIKVLY